jgi:phosphopantothenate-cysteine ligase
VNVLRVLITAGGTSERIDDVRKITNNSTGRLGAALAFAFAEAYSGCEIFYVCGRGAAKPDLPGIREFIVESATDLEAVLFDILSKHQIDVIIHAMAVSDFRLKDAVSGKISSDVDEITLTLQRVPKVISKLRGLAPKAVLVGFKLVSGLCENDLIDLGHEQLLKYDCDLVLANDTANLDPAGHKGWLIRKDKSYEIFIGKTEIAFGIVAKVKTLLERVDTCCTHRFKS